MPGSIIENEFEGFGEKVTGFNKSAGLGAMLTPALIINDELLASGKIPTKSTLAQWLQTAARESAEGR